MICGYFTEKALVKGRAEADGLQRVLGPNAGAPVVTLVGPEAVAGGHALRVAQLVIPRRASAWQRNKIKKQMKIKFETN